MPNLIDSKTKRSQLKPRREPYWAPLQKHASLGYRKPETGIGTWIVRRRDDDGKNKYQSLGTFESFDDAAKAARTWLVNCEKGIANGTITVKDACSDYVEALKQAGRNSTVKDAEGRFRRLVDSSPFGRIGIGKLTSRQLKDWLNKQVATDGDEDDVRRTKDSANRNLANLKAALALAHQNRLVDRDDAWSVVKPFSKVSARRQDAFLNQDERKALLEACPHDLADLCRAALLTGARPGELATLKVKDFNKSHGTLELSGKTGTRVSTMSTAAIDFFSRLSAGKLPNAPLIATSFGQYWNKDIWKKPFKDAAIKAGLPDTVVLYSLRHTAISEMMMAGIDVFTVAKLTGTSVAMIEKNYGHLNKDAVKAKLDRMAI